MVFTIVDYLLRRKRKNVTVPYSESTANDDRMFSSLHLLQGVTLLLEWNCEVLVIILLLSILSHQAEFCQ